ncbi:MAG: hypothetical protein ABSH31_02815 [Bryobacteraceae bacterium]|jgi:hypothetical protein
MTEDLTPIQVTTDPVLSAFELPLRRTFYPLGYPLVLETNSRDVIRAAEEGWGAFERMFIEDPVRVCLGISENNSESPLPASVVRAREHLMSVVADSANFLLCDFDRGFAFGWVTRSTAADHPLLRYQFLTAAGATLAEQRALAPLHGALVVRNGAGVVFCGDSFAGKSTLAYACARAGWTYLSDDATFLVRGRDDRYAIGDPHSIRFRTDARDLFPELAAHLPRVRPNGKIAIEVPTRDLGISTAPGCVVDHVVFLDRQQQLDRPVPVSLRHYSEDRAQEHWEQYAVLGTEEVRTAQRRCYKRLLRARLWEMQYSDLDHAVARLERLVDRGA